MISTRRRPFLLGAMLFPGVFAHRFSVAKALQATPPGAGAGAWTEAPGINDAGQIVLTDGLSAAILTPDGEVVDLGGISFSDASYTPLAINNRGQVVCNTGHGPVLWEDGQTTYLPGMNIVFDINDAGKVCGSNPGGGSSVVWQDGSLTELPVRPGDRASRAMAINNAGQVVGWSGIGWVRYHPVLWDGGELVELPAPPGKEAAAPALYGAATGISDAGHIVGVWDDLTVVWRDGEVVVLPDPTGLSCRATAEAGRTLSVNSVGQIAGTWCGDPLRAVWWDEREAFALPLLPGDVTSSALGNNEAGQIVGWSESETGVSRAVLWQNGEVIDLSQIGRDG